MKILGRNLTIKVGNTAVAAARSCEVSVEAETIEVSSPSTGEWRSFIAGRKSWSVSCSYLVQAPGTERPQAGTSVLLSLTLNGSTVLQGYAIVRACRISADIGSVAKGTFEFVGNGVLS